MTEIIRTIEINGNTFKVSRPLRKYNNSAIIKGIHDGKFCVIDGTIRKTVQYYTDGKVKVLDIYKGGKKKIPEDIEDYTIPSGHGVQVVRNLNVGIINEMDIKNKKIHNDKGPKHIPNQILAQVINKEQKKRIARKLELAMSGDWWF